MPFITARVLSVIVDDAAQALADAGEDQSVLCAATVILDGEILLDDIENHTFEWEQTFGTPVTLINPNTLTPSFVNPQVSDLEFTLYVDRNTPFEDSDVVLVSRRPQDKASASTAASARTSVALMGAGPAQIQSQAHFDADATVMPLAFTEPPATYSPLYTADDLDRVRQWPKANYWMMNDIDLSSYSNWNPIGTALKPFTGDFQGNGFVIDNMTITSNASSVGLFSNLNDGAIVENLGVTNANVTGQTSSFYSSILAGSLTGAISNDGGPVTIRNCYTTGTIDAEGDRAGGFIGVMGTNAGTIIENTYSDVTITNGGGTRVGAWTGIFFDNGTYIENYGNTTKFSPVHGTVGDIAGATEVDGLTTAQLNAEANYTGWNFIDTWEIDEGVSPATLQNDPSLPARVLEATCDRSMVRYETEADQPTGVVGFHVLGQHSGFTYKFVGVRTERLEGTSWVHDAFTPAVQRYVPIKDGTGLRGYWRWQKTINDRVLETIETLHPRSFASKFGGGDAPGGSDIASAGLVGSQSVRSYNLVIAISNPRKIAKSEFEIATASLGSTQRSEVILTTLNRFVGAAKEPTIPVGENVATSGCFGNSFTLQSYALSVTRNNGASIGGG